MLLANRTERFAFGTGFCRALSGAPAAAKFRSDSNASAPAGTGSDCTEIRAHVDVEGPASLGAALGAFPLDVSSIVAVHAPVNVFRDLERSSTHSPAYT